MTTISRWDPFAEMNRLHDQLFSRVAREESFKPAIDIHEDFSHVDVATEHAELVIGKLAGIRVRNQSLKPTLVPAEGKG